MKDHLSFFTRWFVSFSSDVQADILDAFVRENVYLAFVDDVSDDLRTVLDHGRQAGTMFQDRMIFCDSDQLSVVDDLATIEALYDHSQLSAAIVDALT